MTADLTPYLPLLILEWQEETPEERYRSIDGTLVFTDLSGFTAISERLAKLGKLGAEELVEHLDATFAELLAVASEFGGTLIKFGGDALLLFFRGDRHAIRAVRAAADMQTKLRQIGRIRTSAGPARLRMSVGVHTGAFDFFLVGKEHQELLITGPATTTTAEMESAADANEVLLSPDTAACLPPSSIGAEKGGGVLLARTPRVRENDRQPLRPWPSSFDAEAFVPASLRSHLSDPAAAEPEHRQIAIAFIHLANVDRLLAEEGPDEATNRLEALFASVATHFGEHGVAFLATDLYNDGPKILAATGAPRSWGNDEERLLRALRGVADDDHGLDLRIGVNRGYAFAGDIGAPFRRTYVAMGDVVNTAARVMSKAGCGEMLATAGVLERSATAFETEEQAPFTAKGKTLPLVTHRVGRIVGTRRVGGERRPLLGRDAELATLLEGVHAAHRGTFSVIEVVAEPGMGKSRLLEELCDRADDVRVISFECEQYSQATPYASLRLLLEQGLDVSSADGLASSVGSVDRSLLRWLPLVAMPLGLDVESTQDVDQLDENFVKPKLQQVVGDLLCRLLDTAALIVVEDTHWMDEASAEFFLKLLRRPDLPPWFVCLARRRVERGLVATPVASASVELGPLDDGAAVALARLVAPDRFLPRQLDALVARAGGNPLYLAEVVRAAATDGSDLNALPDTVDGLIAARVDTLDAADRRLLRYASVLGATVDLDVLADATAEAVPRDPGAWSSLEDFLEPHTARTLRFRHALYRDVAYEGLSFKRRRELHRLVGETIERRVARPEDEAELLALHFHEARDDTRTWRYALVAGDRARAAFSQAEAASFYRRALTAGGSQPPLDLASVSERLSESLLYAGRYAEAEAAARPPHRSDIGEVMKARLAFLRGEARRRSGRADAARQCYAVGLRTLRDSSGDVVDGWRSRLLNATAGVLHAQGRLAQSVAVLERSVEHAMRAADDRALAHAHMLLFRAFTALGDFVRADQYRDLPLHVYEREHAMLHLSSFENILGWAAQEQGDWASAEAWYGRAARRAAAAGNENQRAMAANNRGEILLMVGRLDDGEAAFHDALGTWRPARYPIGVAVAEANLAAIDAQRMTEGAAGALERAAAELESLGIAEYEALALLRAAEAHLVARDHELASERAAAAGAVRMEGAAKARIESGVLRVQSLLAARAGRREQATALLEQSVRAAERANSPYDRAITVAIWLRLGAAVAEPAHGAADDLDEVCHTLGIVELPRLVQAVPHLVVASGRPATRAAAHTAT